MKLRAKSILLTSMRSPYLDSDRTYPPLGLLYLKSYLNQFGIDVGLEDEFDFSDPSKYERFDAFGASVMTPQRQASLEFLHFCKQHYADKPVIIGGPHARHYLEDVVKESWDYVVPFDGQRSLLRVIDTDFGHWQIWKKRKMIYIYYHRDPGLAIEVLRVECLNSRRYGIVYTEHGPRDIVKARDIESIRSNLKWDSRVIYVNERVN